MEARRVLIIAAVLALALSLAAGLLAGWGGEVRVRAATTTSLYATGLLDYLAERFYEAHPGVRIDFMAVGSGEALRRAAMGDACLVFSHAPNLEARYLTEGKLERLGFMAYNYFVIVGPPRDPAGVSGSQSAVEAFRRIYEAGEAGRALFVSRGDNSGTHAREMLIWRLAGLDPRGRPWYLEVGAGMPDTLVRADELGAYTLSDIGTYLKLSLDGRIPGLRVLYENSTELLNVYSIYVSSLCEGPEREAALAFARFILENQELIASYGVERYGQPLFYPAEGAAWLEEAWRELAVAGGG